MKIEPRTEILHIWRDAAGISHEERRGWKLVGRRPSNTISDAEQLLCFMLPATRLPSLRLERPNETGIEPLKALRAFGTESQIPRVLVEAVIAYLERYREADEYGTPQFWGGAAFDAQLNGAPATEAQAKLDVVESFVVSIQLALASLGFAKVYGESLPHGHEMLPRLDWLNELASVRLSAAMVGLLRSFVVNVFPESDPFAKELLRTVAQGDDTDQVAEKLKKALNELAARMKSLDIGNKTPPEITDRGMLFECGWSWGIAQDAPVILKGGYKGQQQDGYALAAPFLYFTVVALDGIADLDSPRTRQLNLLTSEQLDLANALRVRFELTQQYWATVATFGRQRWALEDIPWRATDGQESDLFTLLVSSIAARDLEGKRGTELDLGRLVAVLEELANRGRITRRPLEKDDPAVELQVPGLRVRLDGSEQFGAAPLTWYSTDYASLLLKRTLAVAAQADDVHTRGRLVQLADDIWDNVNRRRMRDQPGVVGPRLWDQPAEVFPSLDFQYTQLSWHHTLRVIESMVGAAGIVDTPPLRGPQLNDVAEELLGEAEHMLDNEQFRQPIERGAAADAINRATTLLRRARGLVRQRPAHAISLSLDAIRLLDEFWRERGDD